ncbi:efflux RND transporter permease subunit [Oceanicoccus sp. KOV_DT_Chl]|uniref:efflux RND transporter permease subunit n=1 Tax=Oceanicoccus sp. KOV_DT_Chl TaxID=1904639 RepID=UPI0011AEF6AE|nr:efflux RND transporter permease subunit [Oceanicoccus sp. KOV_DT_Chl]
MKSLIAFFARRTLLVNMILAMIIMAGIMVLRSQEYSSYPSMDLGNFTITTIQPGASANDVELSVTVPLEEQILELDGLDEMVSSSMEGVSSILVKANPDNNVSQNAKFAVDLQKAIDRADAHLPKNLPLKPDIHRHNPDVIPVMELLLHGNVSEETLRHTARQLHTELMQLPDVAGVDKEGYRNKEVKILLDPQRVHQLGISYDEIIAAVTGRNVRDSGGSLNSFKSEKDIITVGEFRDPKELAEVIIRVNGPANYLRVRDIAEVVIDYEDWSIQSFTDGTPGISLLVKKEADADGLKVARQLRVFVEEANLRLPHGVTLSTFNDTTRYTRNMLTSLVNNAIAGIILVFLVLMSFFPFRFTIWVAAGIPTAIMLAFIFMVFFDMSINQTSIGALILMLGILVDDAIVVAENIFQHKEAGEDPINAAINGTYGIAAPVLTSSATTLFAFAPLLFLSGIEGKFMWVIPAMVMMVLAASILECNLMLPAHMASALKSQDKKAAKGFRNWFKPVERFYRWWLSHVLSHRYLAFIATTIGAVLIGWVSIQSIDINLYPDGDIDNILIKTELPVGTSFEQTRNALASMDAEIRALVAAEDILNIKFTVGHHDNGDVNSVTEGRQPSWGLISIFLVPLEERENDALSILSKLRKNFSNREDYNSIVVEPYRNTPPTGRSVEVDIIGNHEHRYLVADALTNLLQAQPGVSEVWTTYSPGKDLIELELNHEAIADYGLTVSSITRAVRIAFDGLLIDELQTVDERIKFRLQFQQPEQGKLETLYGLTIINNRGEPVLLRSVAELVSHPGESSIRHFFGDRSITVYAEIDKSFISVAKINQIVTSYIEDNQLRARYPQLRILQGGEVKRQKDALGNVGNAAVLAMAGILFLLVLLFSSVSQPLLVMLVIPLGMVGVFLAFAVQGFDLSMSAMVGMTGLAGILINDSLIMIDRLNKNRGEGPLSQRQIVDAAGSRLRPVFITTLTTVAGLFPAAYGIMGDNSFLRPMIMTMFWGVLFGSLVTLLYLPCLYAMDQDFRRWLKKIRKTV